MTRILPLNDGNTLPQIGFGLWQVPADQTARVVREGLATGYRLIDGAAVYGNETGLGEGLRQSGLPRDAVFVTTKIWNDHHGYDAARRALDASLARLGLDRIDGLLIHWPCPEHDRYVETWKAMVDLRAEGRVTSIGVSNFLLPHLKRLIAETGVTPALNQIELHPRLGQAALRAAHRRLGIVTQSWTPLGQGKSFATPAVAQAAARTGRTPAQVVLRWHLHLGCAIIPRSSRAAGLAENLALWDFDLTPAEIEAITALDTGERTGPDPMLFA